MGDEERMAVQATIQGIIDGWLCLDNQMLQTTGVFDYGATGEIARIFTDEEKQVVLERAREFIYHLAGYSELGKEDYDILHGWR